MKKTAGLKAKIKKKFGTYSNFARIAGIDRYEFQKNFLMKESVPTEMHNDFAFALSRFDNEPKNGKFTDEMRKSLQEAVNAFGGVTEFCNKNPQFSKYTVWHVLSGYYKTVKPSVKQLIDFFENQKGHDVQG